MIAKEIRHAEKTRSAEETSMESAAIAKHSN